MSFLMGKTETHRNVSDKTAGAHDQGIDYISKQGFGGINPSTTLDPSLIEPYQELFRQQNAQNFAQAKESAGNLTGSGLGNYIGTAAQRATTEQGAFLTGLLEQRRQQDANRWAQFTLGMFGSPAAGVTRTYKPGFLDYAFQGAAAAAPFIAGPAGAAAVGGAGAALGIGGAGGGANMPVSRGAGGQLGQSSIYRFLSPQGSTPYQGFSPEYDTFGTPRRDDPFVPRGRF